ncbi:MAG: NPCBM/NEW2 domain-containing protein [Planctomycetota bacterium]
MTRWIFGLFAAIAIARVAPGQGLTVTARTCEDQEIALHDVKLTSGWKVTGTKEGATVDLAGMDLVSIEFSDKPFPNKLKGTFLRFPTGEQLAAELLSSDDEKLRARSSLLGEFTVPLSAIEAAVLDPEYSENITSLVRRAADRHGDEVLLKTRDYVSGTITGVKPDKIALLRDDQEVFLEKARVAGIAFDPSLVDYKSTAEFHAQIRLSDGSVLNLVEIVSDGPKLSLKTGFGASLAVDAAEVVDLSFRNGRVSYLSDMKPDSAVHEPFLDDHVVPRMDRSASGTPLRMRGRVYAKGIGVRSRSELTYPLDGFVRFDAIVGLDESAGPQASVRFRVLVDGQAAFDSGEMIASTDPRPVQVPVRNAKRLTLVVEYESRGDVQDFADWCDARLSR